MISGEADSVNALYVYEVQSVVESGAYGDLQRWQLTIIHLAFAKESCDLRTETLLMQGLFTKE